MAVMDSSKVVRPSVLELDAILGVPFPVLDSGFVRLVDYMGNDASVVQAARVSYGSGTKSLREDRALLRYLMRHRHTTPFEMCELKLHVRVPMDCWRQWIRHRTASVNEYSTRYSVAIDAAHATASDAWRLQDVSNRQGSGEMLPSNIGSELSRREADFHKAARALYEERIRIGVAREQARKDLPLSTYTEAYWKIDLHNLLHFLELRMNSHAQAEIRAYAEIIGFEIVKRWCPDVWDAFQDCQMGAISLTRVEQAILAALVRSDSDGAIATATSAGLITKEGLPTRELAEAGKKLRALGFTLPWENNNG